MNECEIIDTIVLSSVSALAQDRYLILIESCEVYCMENSQNDLLAFQDEQDEIFLSLVKNRTLYYMGDFFHIFAKFSKNGKTILLTDEFEIPFSQSFSPLQGIYHINNESFNLFIGILARGNRSQIFLPPNVDDLFKKNGKQIFILSNDGYSIK